MHAKGFQILEEDLEKKAILSLEYNLKMEPGFVLYFYYGNEKFLPNSIRRVAVNIHKENSAYIFEKVKRNTDWENLILSDLKEIGLKENNGYFLPDGFDLLENKSAVYYLVNWINRNKIKLEKQGIGFIQDVSQKNYFTGEQTSRN